MSAKIQALKNWNYEVICLMFYTLSVHFFKLYVSFLKLFNLHITLSVNANFFALFVHFNGFLFSSFFVSLKN